MNAVPITVLYFVLQRYFVIRLSVWKIIFFAIFLVTGYLINFLIDFLIALYSFYFSRVSSLYTSIRVLKNISAGIVFPLVLLPKSVFTFLQNTPFVFISYIPVTLLLDDVPMHTALFSLCKAFGWITTLSILCATVWKRGMKIYSAYGG